MKILRPVHSGILQGFANATVEMGCILGAKQGVVCAFAFDGGTSPQADCYQPNVQMLNLTIANWHEQGISFVGLAHNHPVGQTDLSQTDKTYAQNVAHANNMEGIYFPLVVAARQGCPPTLVAHFYNGSWSVEEVQVV